MKITHRYLLLLISSCLFFSCKKTDVQPDPVPEDKAYQTRPVRVEIPSDVKVDLTTCVVHSLSVSSTISAEGKSDVAYNKGYPNIAWVFDKENRIILAGFITDTSAMINTRSTADVLVYFGYGMSLYPYALTNSFLTKIGEIKHLDEWRDAFDAEFKKNPLTLANGGFKEAMKLAMKKMSAGRKMNAIPPANTTALSQKKLTDITILNNSERSGILASSEELTKIFFDNSYRRRAHAFLYKVKSVTDAGVTNTTMESGSITTLETIVDPAAGFTSTAGVLGSVVEDKETEFAMVRSGPININLNDNESEAEYRLRIIGPGMPGTNNTITDQEAAKLTQLEIETIALDYLLPVMMEVVGNKDDLALIDGSRHVSGPIEDFLKATGSAIKVIPGVYEEIRKGQYPSAFRKMLEGMYTELHAAVFEDMVKLTASILEMAVSKKYYIPANVNVFKEAEKKVKILKLIDLALFGNDLVRMGVDIGMSNQVEDFTVRAISPKVTLQASKLEVAILEQTKITCEIKNFQESGGDQHAFFEWKTSGRFGKISDTKGHTNLASFASADRDVFYYSNAKLEDLSDNDNFDTIFVVAKFGSYDLGKDTIVINVKKETSTFTVPLEGHISATEGWDDFANKPIYKAGPPYYTATFKHRENAKSYSIRIVRKDGSKGNATIYYPNSDWVKNGIFNYQVIIGGIRFFESYSYTAFLAEKERQEKLLADTGHKAIEVTVNY